MNYLAEAESRAQSKSNYIMNPKVSYNTDHGELWWWPSGRKRPREDRFVHHNRRPCTLAHRPRYFPRFCTTDGPGFSRGRQTHLTNAGPILNAICFTSSSVPKGAGCVQGARLFIYNLFQRTCPVLADVGERCELWVRRSCGLSRSILTGRVEFPRFRGHPNMPNVVAGGRLKAFRRGC